jgi:hypothetical protein
MELTITQNGALYALHHRANRRYRGAHKKRAGTDLIRAFPTSLEEFAKPLIPAEGLGPRHKWSGTR